MSKGSVHQALYRKYRPRKLDDVYGQEHVTALLKRSIESGRINHAYLLTGPKGVGKTSIARILAHEINGLDYSDDSSHLDIIEIDAASNNGVDDVRELRDNVRFAPTVAAKKIYIIDEVHMLSKPAFNALLKTLEEPPEHVVFILATTDADKLPETIISRVHRYQFRKITDAVSIVHLRRIANAENIEIDDQALTQLAKHGGGSFRDSIGLLDQLSNGYQERINEQLVLDVLGIPADRQVDELISAYRQASVNKIVEIIDNFEANGTNPVRLSQALIAMLKQTLSERPNDSLIMEDLLAVASSSYPFIKLLTVLVSNTSQTYGPEPSASASPTPVATKPLEATVANQPPVAKPKKASSLDVSKPSTFSWQNFIDQLKNDSAVQSLLSKSNYQLDENSLIIFAGNRFNANRLNAPKQLTKLNDALNQLGFSSLNIEVKADVKPPEDSETAAVAAIMGGGEEVDYAE
jgi:DNA polymerase-3 subunit gamma/tau